MEELDLVSAKSLGSLLYRASWVLTNTLNAALREQGIDLQHSQYRILRVLYECEGVSQNAIAANLQMDAAAIKRSVDYLEKKGYAVRRPLSGCKYGIYLTEYGKAMKPEIVSIADKVTEYALAGMSDEMCAQGMMFLEHIMKIGARGGKK